MSHPPTFHGQPLALAPAGRYRVRKFAGFVFVIICIVLAGLITLAVLTQPRGGAIIPLYGVVVVLFVPFFFLASRQRAAIYPDGIVPSHRRVAEFLGGKRSLVPFDDIDRVVLVRNQLAPSQFLYAQVFLTNGRRETLDSGEVGRELLQCLADISEGRAISGLTLRHEYRVEKW